MVAKKPVGDGARKGAVRRGSQIKIKLIGRDAWTKRNKRGGQVHGRQEEQEKI